MNRRKAATVIKARAYARGSRPEKARILDEPVEPAGWNRDYARRALRQALELRPVPVPLLRRDGELDLKDAEAVLLMRMSAATIDRKLAPERAKLMLRGRSHTKPGSLLEPQIPVRTWADWDDGVPGFVEIDLVGHEGGRVSGQFCFTLAVTDIATGWTVNRPVPNMARKWVFAALQYAVGRFPFPILGMDPDNGSEFGSTRPPNRPFQMRQRSSLPGPVDVRQQAAFFRAAFRLPLGAASPPLGCGSNPFEAMFRPLCHGSADES